MCPSAHSPAISSLLDSPGPLKLGLPERADVQCERADVQMAGHQQPPYPLLAIVLTGHIPGCPGSSSDPVPQSGPLHPRVP